MLAGDLYLADDPELAEEHLGVMRLMEAYNRTPAGDDAERRRILGELLGACGAGSEIRPPLYCDLGHHLRVGARTFVNVWLGGGVIVLPGVSIGENSVVGAGAVVTRNLPGNVVAVGNPARVVRRIEA